MFGQFNDLPRSEARDRASEVSKDTEGGAAATYLPQGRMWVWAGRVGQGLRAWRAKCMA